MLCVSASVNKPCAKRFERLHLLQFEIDIHRVAISCAKTTGERVNAGHTLERRKNGRIHHGIAATFDNFRAGNRTVFENFDFDGADKRFVLLKNGCRLLPLAEEPVMDQLVIPAKLPSGTCSTFARASRSASSSALTQPPGFCRSLPGGLVSFTTGRCAGCCARRSLG